MLPNIGDGADGGLCPPALEAVVFPVGGDLIQHAEIGGKQQRPVVQQPPLCHPLCAAGDLQIADGDITGSVLPCGNADGVQRRDHRGKHSVVVQSAGTDDIRVIHIPQIVIDRPAAADPAHHGNSPLPQRLHVHLPADVLIAAHHHRRSVLPQQENIIVQIRLVNIFLKGLVVKRIVGNVLHRKHTQTPPFSCAEGST